MDREDWSGRYSMPPPPPSGPSHGERLATLERIVIDLDKCIRWVHRSARSQIKSLEKKIDGIYETAWRTVWSIAVGALLVIFNLLWSSVIGKGG